MKGIKEQGSDMDYINAKYLCTKPLAVQKAYGYVFADIMTKVSHLVPIVFVNKPDGKYVSFDCAGTFTRKRLRGETTWKPEHIGVVLDDDLETTIRVLLHEVGHFVYMNTSKESITRFNLSDYTSSTEAMADTFVVDYIDSTPLWVQAALKCIRNTKAILIKDYYNISIEEINFDGKEVYTNLVENDLLHLLNKE